MVTVFIRISAHLEKAPILKVEKVDKRPASNKRPPPPPGGERLFEFDWDPTVLSE